MHANIYSAVVLVTLAVTLGIGALAAVLNRRRLSAPLPRDLEGIFDPERYLRAVRYARECARLSGVSTAAVTLLFLGFWGAGGFGSLDRWLRSLGWPDLVTGLVYLGVLAAAGGLVTIPFDLYSTFVIEQRFGFNRTRVRTWVLDRLKGLAIAVALGLPMMSGILWLFATFPESAWLWCWGLVAAFNLIVQLVFPALLLPMFYRFSPLPDGPLRQALLGYAAAVGFGLDDVFVIDGSRRSSKANAFFTGAGRTKRIALFDTLIERLDTAQLVAVTAHEVGHFRRRHLWIRAGLGVVQVGAMLALLQVFVTHRGLFFAFDVDQPSVAVGLVLFALLASPIDSVVAIAANALSRRFELAADRYAAETTGDPEALIAALIELARDHLAQLNPHPLLVFLEYSHPPLGERIAALRAVG